MTDIAQIATVAQPRVCEVFEKARANCECIRGIVRNTTTALCQDLSLDPASVCLVAVGSVGRMEALAASDLDLVPVLRDQPALDGYRPHDIAVRASLAEATGLHVSQGADLTKCVSVDELTDLESIGGDSDCSSALTRRILLLTEGAHLAGGLEIDAIRTDLLHAYGGQYRTRGRHMLSFCNDLARYYRTLCIEYKAKVDIHDKDWCTRNVKLRHSRKFWYFSTLLAVVALAERHLDEERFAEDLLIQFGKPPVDRLLFAQEVFGPLDLRKILEAYASFLSFMADEAHRNALEAVDYEGRYEVTIRNPFPLMKTNSDMMHVEMIRVIQQLPVHARNRVFDWFVL